MNHPQHASPIVIASANDPILITIPQPTDAIADGEIAARALYRATQTRLRATIADLVAESVRLRPALGASGPERHELHLRRRIIGRRTRHALLALACLRGRPLSRVEPRIHDRTRSPLDVALYLAGLSRVPVMPGPERDRYDAVWSWVSPWLKT